MTVTALGDKTVRAAVIGCGDVSVVHLAALGDLPNVELVAVCDTDERALARAATQSGAAAFGDHQVMLDRIKPDVVHICTPHHTHVGLAVDALAAGSHVLLEKPVAHTRSDAARLVQATEQYSERMLGVCLQNRYNAPVQAARALLGSGELGAISGAHATVFWHRDGAYYRDKPWRGRWETSGGGLLMNQAIHTVDLLQWLLGEVCEVRGGVAQRLLGELIEVEDTADAVLTHANGLVSTLFATLSNAVNAPVTLDIAAENATLTVRGDLTVRYRDGRTTVTPERSAHRGGRAYWGVSHGVLIEDFYDSLRCGQRFGIDAVAAARSLDVVQRIYDAEFSAADDPRR